MTTYRIHYVRHDGTRGSLDLRADSKAMARFAGANQLADDNAYDGIATPDWEIVDVLAI